MKRYISLIVALVLVVTGIIGTFACISPSKMKESKVIYKYINAIDDGKIAKMMKYTIMGGYSDAISNALGNASEELLQMSGVDTSRDTVGGCLFLSGMNAASKIPSDAKEVKSVELVCYNKAEDPNAQFSIEDFLGLSKSVKVLAVVEVEYIDADGETVTVLSDETFHLVRASFFGYKISSLS